MQKSLMGILLISLVFSLLMACSKEIIIDPDKPITINLWHYYNGKVKTEFDDLVAEFNDTVGKEEGVVVEPRSYGEINLLETALFNAAKEEIGSEPLPDVFAAYSDHAYRMAQIIDLVPLESYLSKSETALYREEFLKEGQFLKDGKSYIFLVAKSTENLYVNKTDWEKFAREQSFSNKHLETWEGIYEVAKKYYEETGRAFLGHDSIANFMIIFSKQYGNDLYKIGDQGQATFTMTEANAKAIWDYFYRPYLKGYFKKLGRFSSDDARTKDVLAYISSTASSNYFPKEITASANEIYTVDPLVIPYPYTAEGSLYAVQQGAGMSVVKTDQAHEYGAFIFLKWFTNVDKNVQFTLNSGYLPVQNAAFDKGLVIEEVSKSDIDNKAMIESFITTNEMLQSYKLFSGKPFMNSYEMRSLIGSHLYEKILKDLDILQVRIENGEKREDILEEMLAVEQFEEWFDSLKNEAEVILK